MTNMQPGDVIQVRTALGPAFVQCVCKNVDGLDVMRAFPLRSKEQGELHEFVSGPVQFWFLAVGRALLLSERFSLIGNVPIPDNTEIPLSRGYSDAPNAYVVGLDGITKRVDRLTAEMRRLPLNIAIPADDVIDKIVTGWTPELGLIRKSGRSGIAKPAEAELGRARRRLLVFVAGEKSSADGLAVDLAARGFHSKLRKGEGDWEVEAAFHSSTDMAEDGKAEAACQALADKWGARFLASEQEL